MFFLILEKGGEAERNINLLAPGELNPQFGSVPSPGIEPETFCCTGQCSTDLATPTRIHLYFLILDLDEPPSVIKGIVKVLTILLVL